MQNYDSDEATEFVPGHSTPSLPFPPRHKVAPSLPTKAVIVSGAVL